MSPDLVRQDFKSSESLRYFILRVSKHIANKCFSKNLFDIKEMILWVGD